MILKIPFFLSLASAMVLTSSLPAQTVVFQDTFSADVDMERNRYGSDNGDFAYRISYTDANSLGNAVNNPYTGVNPWGYDVGSMKVMAQGVNGSTSADNVVQVSSWFERTTIGVGQSMVLDADVRVFGKSHLITGANLGVNNMLRFGLVNMPNTSAAWKRSEATPDDTVLIEGIGNSTFTGTGFMSNFQTGTVGSDPTVSRLSPLTRNPTVDNRLATNTGGAGRRWLLMPSKETLIPVTLLRTAMSLGSTCV